MTEREEGRGIEITDIEFFHNRLTSHLSTVESDIVEGSVWSKVGHGSESSRGGSSW